MRASVPSHKAGARRPIITLRSALDIAAFAVMPAAFLLGLVHWTMYAFDFAAFWQAGRDVLDGVSPYAGEISAERFAAALRDTQEATNTFGFVYPAPAALAMTPLALLPLPVATGVFTAIILASVPLTLRVLGVRDWRCYGAVFLWVGVLTPIGIGSLTPLLALGLALVWRYRSRPSVLAPVLAATVVLKLFLWPLLVWLLATGRKGSAFATAAAGAAATLGSWWVLGFAGFADYPRLVDTLASTIQEQSFSAVALGLSLGLSEGLAQLASLAGGAALLAWMFALARREDGDRLAFTVAIAASLVLTPLVWDHYAMLIVVPLAIARPRLTALWLVPLGLWTTSGLSHGETWRILVTLGVTAFVLWASARPEAAGWELLRRRPVSLRRTEPSPATAG